MKTKLALFIAFVLVLALFASMHVATRNDASVLAQGPVGDPPPCPRLCPDPPASKPVAKSPHKKK